MNARHPGLGRITVLGACILDVLGRPVEAIPPGQGSVRLTEIKATAAGTAAGPAVDLAKLGASVRVIGALGDDLLGDIVTAAMARHGVETACLVRKKGVQTSATILPIRPNGERPALHVPGATRLLGRADVDLEHIRDSRALLIGAPDALAGMTGEELAEIAVAARSHGALVAVDVLHPGRPQDLDRLAPLLAQADWFMPNADQLLNLTGRASLTEAMNDILSLGTHGVAVTQGADGCQVATRPDRTPESLPALAADVVDTTGCGRRLQRRDAGRAPARRDPARRGLARHRLRRPGRHRPGLRRRDREPGPGAQFSRRRTAGPGRPDQGADQMNPPTFGQPTFGQQSTDQQLRDRAKAVIPGGMYGHQAAPGAAYPQFMRGGRGARVWDVDGHEYVDLMCSYGPVVLGHRHPAVEAAVAVQTEQGDCQNGPGPVMVDLAELMVATVRHADWAIFAKNGTDATTMCCTIARAQTQKNKILVARGAYHGAAPWCTPRPAGTTKADHENLIRYTFNDLESVKAAAAEAGDDLAGILVSPFKHDAGFDQELVDPAFARGLRKLCDEKGAALILDDVRCGFRLHLGSSWEPVGVDPDLSAWSKAIANGRALAAVLGHDRFRDGAASVFVTGSFWFAAVPMAAAIATIRALKEEKRHRGDGPDGHPAARRDRGPG